MTKWPKILPPLTPEQMEISNDFMKHWHDEISSKGRYSYIERFNHLYPIKNSKPFISTLEIGAGLGEHLYWEKLNHVTRSNYHALELRQNMALEIKKRHSNIHVHVGDCQEYLPFIDNSVDRILAIHVLEHLPNLPAALKEIHRICKKTGEFLIVIPCEGGLVYNLARKISAQRLFEKKYKQSYDWFISREHINKPDEIIEELTKYFSITHKAYFPLKVPNVNLNLCIGLKLIPLT